jgi:hypothetical protein
MKVSKENKLVISVPPEMRTSCEVIRIDKEAADILNKLYAETGLSIRFLASDMIKYAAQNCEIEFGGKKNR